ncbi:hypothetical protein U1Q18_041308 [Sarracenia purpurea var. burkii]
MYTNKGGCLNLIFYLIIFTFFFCGELDFALVAGISTLKSGDELNSTDTLVSDGGNFTLGFFTLTDYSYLGIWYSNDVQARKVWVANANSPIPESSGVLTVDFGTGILRITSRGSTVLNISDQSTGAATATLEDSGNFVLTDETSKRTLWQSFDHPTNALLPGMKLGSAGGGGRNWSLTSWLSESVPASGAFNLIWEPTQDSGQLVVLRRGEPYWTSGLLKDQTFGSIPALNSPFLESHYNFSFVSTDSEKYFTFSGLRGSLWMFLLRPDGGIEDGANSVYGPSDFCYGYESDNGCVASELPRCRSSKDSFVQKRANFLPSIARDDYDPNSTLTLSDCMERCWSNCNCVGFANNSNGTGCIIWVGKLEYHEDNVNTVPIYVLVRPSKRKTWIWILISVSISLHVLIMGVFFYLRMRKQKLEDEEKRRWKESLQELITSESFDNANDIEDDGTEGHPDLKMLSFASIVEATNNFSQENQLGRGGFGPVYKAWELWKEGIALELKDPLLGDSCAANQLLRIIHVALLCVQEGAADRPIMSDVVSMISNETTVLPAPRPPAFFTGRNVISKAMADKSKSKHYSGNSLTITTMEAR